MRTFSELEIDKLLISRQQSLVFHSRVVAEVYGQPQPAGGRAQIVQDLTAMFVNQRGHRLDLDDDFFIADEIRGKCLNECTPAILQSLRWF